MSEYRETRTVVEDVPIKRARPAVETQPVVETQYDSVVHDSRGMSGGAIAALVLAAIGVGILITMLILNNQQRDSDAALAQERARADAAQQAAAQQPQQPPVVVLPQSQPGVLPVPGPAPSQPAPAVSTPTSTELELDVTSKLLDDQDLRVYPIDVKVTAGTAMLSGHVPTDELKARAEQIAKTVKGIRGVINSIVVKPE